MIISRAFGSVKIWSFAPQMKNVGMASCPWSCRALDRYAHGSLLADIVFCLLEQTRPLCYLRGGLKDNGFTHRAPKEKSCTSRRGSTG